MEKVKEAAEKVKEFLQEKAFRIAVVGGSGISFGKATAEIPYSEIPYMPKTSIPGHEGVLKVFEIKGKKLLFFEGRFHYYEGKTDEEIAFIPFLCYHLGVKVFLPTCSSGAVSKRGLNCDVGIIVDHLNLMGRNPLVGLSKLYGSKVFVNGKNFYSKRLERILLETGGKLGLKVKKLVLAGMLGPNYETTAEVKWLKSLGVDCVSMSTVPEVIVSNFLGMETVGLTITVNDAFSKETSHEEVIEAAKRKSLYLSKLIEKALLEF